VFFRDGAAPADEDRVAWARELAEGVGEATNEGLFNNKVLTFAERHQLRVIQVVHGSDHRYPAGDVITVTFDVDKPLSINVSE
jgi:hypothetical protein